jgi:predicted Zn-dependent protease
MAIAFTAAAGCASVSTQQEVEMGAQYAQQINAQLPIVRDAEINRYINVLGEQIARGGGHPRHQLDILRREQRGRERVRGSGRTRLPQPRG